MKLVHCSSDDQLADILTKPVGKMRFERLKYDIGVRRIMTKEECCEVAIHAMANLDRKAASSPRDASSLNVAS